MRGFLVAFAAAGVFGTGTRWPGLAVVALMSALVLQTSILTARTALAELRGGNSATHGDHAGHAH